MRLELNKERLNILLKINIVLIIIAISFITIEWIIGYRIQCPIHHFTNINCPGCGTTRLMESIIFDFNIYQAFRWNPFVFIFSPVVVIEYIRQNIYYLKYGRLTNNLDKELITFAILLIAFGVLRNIPVFEFMAPTLIS